MVAARRLMLAGLAGLVMAAGFASGEVPRWRSGGSDPVEAGSLTTRAPLTACPSRPLDIVILGDSHVTGERSGTDAVPFGAVLDSALPGGGTVTLLGHGGDTAAMGAARWQSRARAGDLVIIAYGTNDAAPRGWLRGKKPVPVPAFTATLGQLLSDWRAAGRRPVLLAPPPGGSAAIAKRIAPYRAAVAMVGKQAQVTLLDPADAFASCAADQPMLGYDALHMSAAGHQCLGEWMAAQLCPVHP